MSFQNFPPINYITMNARGDTTSHSHITVKFKRIHNTANRSNSTNPRQPLTNGRFLRWMRWMQFAYCLLPYICNISANINLSNLGAISTWSSSNRCIIYAYQPLAGCVLAMISMKHDDRFKFYHWIEALKTAVQVPRSWVTNRWRFQKDRMKTTNSKFYLS